MDSSSDLSSKANSVSSSSSNFICRKLESSFNEVDFSTDSSCCTTTTDSCCTTDDAGEGGYSPGSECQSLSQQGGFVQVKPPSPSPSPSLSPSRRGSWEGEEGWLIDAAANIGRNAVAAAPFKLPSENHGCFLWFTSIRDISDEYLQELQGTLALR
jgi:hypothetical protein